MPALRIGVFTETARHHRLIGLRASLASVFVGVSPSNSLSSRQTPASWRPTSSPRFVLGSHLIMAHRLHANTHGLRCRRSHMASNFAGCWQTKRLCPTVYSSRRTTGYSATLSPTNCQYGLRYNHNFIP